jgi:small subunit ribosomal protein S5
MAEFLEDSNALESTTVAINRTATTVKGGRRMSFSALVVVGDRNGRVGVGYGKGRGVPTAIEKSQKDAKKNLFSVKLHGGTLPHQAEGKSCASRVRLIPAAPGTGVIAGGTVRAVLEMAGVHDCLSKAYGSTNKINLCHAVVEALQSLRTREEIAELRGVKIESSSVDEMLTAAKRFMTEAELAGPAKKPAPVQGNKKKRNSKKGKQKGDQPQVENAAPESTAPEAATAVEEAPPTPAEGDAAGKVTEPEIEPQRDPQPTAADTEQAVDNNPEVAEGDAPKTD